MGNNEKMVIEPNNMIHLYWHLDLKVKRSCKVRQESQHWFGEQVQHQIQSGCEPGHVKVLFEISFVKLIQANWFTVL